MQVGSHMGRQQHTNSVAMLENLARATSILKETLCAHISCTEPRAVRRGLARRRHLHVGGVHPTAVRLAPSVGLQEAECRHIPVRVCREATWDQRQSLARHVCMFAAFLRTYRVYGCAGNRAQTPTCACGPRNYLVTATSAHKAFLWHRTYLVRVSLCVWLCVAVAR